MGKNLHQGQMRSDPLLQHLKTKKTNSFIVTQRFFALEAFFKKKKILRVLYAIGMEHYMRRLTPLAVLV